MDGFPTTTLQLSTLVGLQVIDPANCNLVWGVPQHCPARFAQRS